MSGGRVEGIGDSINKTLEARIKTPMDSEPPGVFITP